MSFSASANADTKGHLKAKMRKALADNMVEQRAHDKDADFVQKSVANAIDLMAENHDATKELRCEAYGSVWDSDKGALSMSLTINTSTINK